MMPPLGLANSLPMVSFLPNFQLNATCCANSWSITRFWWSCSTWARKPLGDTSCKAGGVMAGQCWQLKDQQYQRVTHLAGHGIWTPRLSLEPTVSSILQVVLRSPYSRHLKCAISANVSFERARNRKKELLVHPPGTGPLQSCRTQCGMMRELP